MFVSVCLTLAHAYDIVILSHTSILLYTCTHALVMYGRGDSSRGRDYRSRGRGTRGDGPPDSKYHKQVSDEAEEEVRELFQKKYTFKDELNEWTAIPDPALILHDPLDYVDELIDGKNDHGNPK